MPVQSRDQHEVLTFWIAQGHFVETAFFVISHTTEQNVQAVLAVFRNVKVSARLQCIRFPN